MKFMFKVGDKVEWDYNAPINTTVADPLIGMYNIEKIYENYGEIYVYLVNEGGPYYQQRFKLSKNSIVRDIIEDL